MEIRSHTEKTAFPSNYLTPGMWMWSSRFLSGFARSHRDPSVRHCDPRSDRPLRERARPGDRVGVVFSDITRPTPNHLLIPAVLAELDGVPRENITLFNAWARTGQIRRRSARHAGR